MNSLPAHVQRHHFLVEHIHESSRRCYDNVNAFSPDEIRLLFRGHPSNRQHRPQLGIPVVFQLIADQSYILARLLRQLSGGKKEGTRSEILFNMQ